MSKLLNIQKTKERNGYKNKVLAIVNKNYEKMQKETKFISFLWKVDVSFIQALIIYSSILLIALNFNIIKDTTLYFIETGSIKNLTLAYISLVFVVIYIEAFTKEKFRNYRIKRALYYKKNSRNNMSNIINTYTQYKKSTLTKEEMEEINQRIKDSHPIFASLPFTSKGRN